MKRWSEEKAWEWYNSHPWIRGCNYMSADCINRVDQWQELHFEERLKKCAQHTFFNRHYSAARKNCQEEEEKARSLYGFK